MTANELRDLAVAVVDAYVEGGKVKPVLPKGRRDEVASTLELLMVDETALSDYLDTLDDQLAEKDPSKQLLWAYAFRQQEIPFEEIAKNGFGCLTDDVLAECAISPETIDEIHHYVAFDARKIGDWFDNAPEYEGADDSAE